MKTVCENNKCAACMACVKKCPKGAIHIEDSVDANNAIIDENLCVNCNACFTVCQVNNPVELKYPNYWLQGWNTEEESRARSSSGGAATAIMNAVVEAGGTVCACTFDSGSFGFKIADSKELIGWFGGSKYVKSDPRLVYEQCLETLKKGYNLLFIGLPCQVAGIKNFMGGRYDDQIICAELICHGSPSPKVLEAFLKTKGTSFSKIQDIKFRKKENVTGDLDYKKVVPDSVQDFYTFSFLKGITYTENCYTCPYARTERAADITLGDSWGSDLSLEEKKKGISLIMCQTEKGYDLVKKVGMHIESVDRDKSIKANKQLREPSKMPPERKVFFERLKKYGFTFACMATYPKKYVKYLMKKVFCGLKRGKYNEGGGYCITYKEK